MISPISSQSTGVVQTTDQKWSHTPSARRIWTLEGGLFRGPVRLCSVIIPASLYIKVKAYQKDANGSLRHVTKHYFTWKLNTLPDAPVTDTRRCLSSVARHTIGKTFRFFDTEEAFVAYHGRTAGKKQSKRLQNKNMIQGPLKHEQKTHSKCGYLQI